jgi:hypothetical protein
MMVEVFRKALEIRFKSGNNLSFSCSLLIAFTFLDDEWCVRKWEGSEE